MGPTDKRRVYEKCYCVRYTFPQVYPHMLMPYTCVEPAELLDTLYMVHLTPQTVLQHCISHASILCHSML